MTEKEKMEEYLKGYPPKLRNAVTIVESSELPGGLLHISIDPKIKRFFPSVSTRTMNAEDRTIARVSTSPTIVGCIIGYCAMLDDWYCGPHAPKEYKGGYYIYRINHEVSLRPDQKLLPDVGRTGEHWLVGYSANRFNYTGEIIGKLFVNRVALRNGKNGSIISDVSAYLECSSPLEVVKGDLLEPGCYAFSFDNYSEWDETRIKGKGISVERISRAEYNKFKNCSASMLSYVEPPSVGWRSW